MIRNDLFLAVLVMAIWGGNFSMIKMGITEVHSLSMTASLTLLVPVFAQISGYFIFKKGLFDES